ncbi:hypothetical protein IFM89_036340 [Coptis chinensis]|uniref:Uncharacterized protein n=1 Tax=Coptis chinensis TaxID=261450 RepID=A0A835II01_9MAGN|nr:hypothetical protein IFM89_036340 [Coptis chinensis]
MFLMGESLVNNFISLGADEPEEINGNHKESAIASSCSQQSNISSLLAETRDDNVNTTERLNQGFMQYGCSHYRRRCQIRASCCNEIFYCCHCHNEAKNNIIIEGKLRHDLPRHEVQQVICSLCGTEQEQVGQVCVNCGVYMGKYFCKTCIFYDDDTSRSQYHCNGCGICRIGGHEIFFHCYKCGCCYSVHLKNSHPCVEGAMHPDCLVCFDYLFESRNDITVMPCGHTIHTNCLKEMRQHLQYAYPICSKYVCDICPRCRRSLRWKLPQHQCLNHITIKRFGFCAMTVEQPQKFSFMWWLRNA